MNEELARLKDELAYYEKKRNALYAAGERLDSSLVEAFHEIETEIKRRIEKLEK